MKEHFCPAEQSTITYQVQCNWCGQKEWVGLTDEEREQVINANTSTGLWHMAKAIEAKLKEKNT